MTKILLMIYSIPHIIHAYQTLTKIWKILYRQHIVAKGKPKSTTRCHLYSPYRHSLNLLYPQIPVVVEHYKRNIHHQTTKFLMFHPPPDPNESSTSSPRPTNPDCCWTLFEKYPPIDNQVVMFYSIHNPKPAHLSIPHLELAMESLWSVSKFWYFIRNDVWSPV